MGQGCPMYRRLDSDYLIIQQTQNYYRYIQHLITITNNDNYNNIKYKYQY